MTTKYIVNGATSANINGPINGIGTYKALLTQTGTITGNSISYFNYNLIIGETYTISSYSAGDDFSNIANVQEGTINTTGCVFIATDQYPTTWSHGTTLVSAGDMVVSVIENTLPFGIDWTNSPFGGSGYYIAVTSGGPTPFSFPLNSTSVRIQTNYPFNWGGSGGISPFLTPTVGSFDAPEDVIIIDTWELISDDVYPNALYYTPIEINIKY